MAGLTNRTRELLESIPATLGRLAEEWLRPDLYLWPKHLQVTGKTVQIHSSQNNLMVAGVFTQGQSDTRTQSLGKTLQILAAIPSDKTLRAGACVALHPHQTNTRSETINPRNQLTVGTIPATRKTSISQGRKNNGMAGVSTPITIVLTSTSSHVLMPGAERIQPPITIPSKHSLPGLRFNVRIRMTHIRQIAPQ